MISLPGLGPSSRHERGTLSIGPLLPLFSLAFSLSSPAFFRYNARRYHEKRCGVDWERKEEIRLNAWAVARRRSYRRVKGSVPVSQISDTKGVLDSGRQERKEGKGRSKKARTWFLL